MSALHYEWKNGPAILKAHSKAKHKVLQGYLTEYFRRLCASWSRDSLKLTLVDAFSGGGVYDYNGMLCDGSPLILLNAEKEAKYWIEQSGRRKAFNFDISFFFVDKDTNATKLLHKCLLDKGYSHRIDKDIYVFNDDFLLKADFIIDFIKKKSPRNGRSIFILDQYGYKQVPFKLIKKILTELPAAEIILTFAVDALINFLTEKNNQSHHILTSIDIVAAPILDLIKTGGISAQRYAIQACLYQEIISQTTAKFYTPFFIRGEQGHGDFWLIHLSQHKTARDVMANVHWLNHNNFIHYGGAGLNMLGYSQNLDFLDQFNTKDQFDLGFQFDAQAKEKSITFLCEDILKHIYDSSKPLSIEQLFTTTCNTTPATLQLYKEAISSLLVEKQLDVTSIKGSKREKIHGGSNLDQTDFLSISQQQGFRF